jgi:hypothetical protein
MGVRVKIMAIDSISLGIQSFLAAAAGARLPNVKMNVFSKEVQHHSQRRSGNVRNFYQRAIKTSTDRTSRVTQKLST